MLEIFLITLSIVLSLALGFSSGFLFGLSRRTKHDPKTIASLRETIDELSPNDSRVISPSKVRERKEFEKDFSENI